MTWPQRGPVETEAAVPREDRLRSSERLMAIMQRREEETRHALDQRKHESLETLYRVAAAHELPILVVRDGDRYDTDRATIVCWAEVVVYLAADFGPEPNCHPGLLQDRVAVPGCPRAHRVRLALERHRTRPLRARQARAGYVHEAMARVVTGNAERTNDRIARLAEQNRPAASRLADAVRAVARGGDY